MKIHQRKKQHQHGLTLIELALAMMLTVGISVALLGLIQQQISFSKTLNAFRFLRDEAPQVNTLVTNIVNKADNYRIYKSTDSAKAFNEAVREEGTAIRLRFRNPDGTSDHAIIAFEEIDSEKQLNYYFRDRNSNTWPSSPNWTISKAPKLVQFENSTGVLTVTLQGKNNDQIAYAGTPN